MLVCDAFAACCTAAMQNMETAGMEKTTIPAVLLQYEIFLRYPVLQQVLHSERGKYTLLTRNHEKTAAYHKRKRMKSAA